MKSRTFDDIKSHFFYLILFNINLILIVKELTTLRIFTSSKSIISLKSPKFINNWRSRFMCVCTVLYLMYYYICWKML